MSGSGIATIAVAPADIVFTYDLDTDAGLVRLLCTDSVEAYAIFGDSEIDSFLTMESGSVKKAAAMALETIASSEVLVQKRIKLLDLSTDGPAESAELLKRAGLLRTQAAEEAETAEEGEFSPIDFAELIYDDFSLRERIVDEALDE